MISISDETNTEKIERKSKKNVLLGTIFGYLAVLVSIVYGLFLTPEIINFVGKAEYGLYGLSSSVVNLFLMDFGLSAATHSFLARLRADGNKEGVERYVAGIFKIYLFLDIFFVLIIAALYFSAPYVFARSYGNPITFERTESIKTLQWLFIIIGCFTIINLPCYVFNGTISTYEKFSMLKLADVIQKGLYLLFSVLSVLLHWKINGSGIIPIVVVNVASALLSILIKALYSRFYLNLKFDLRKNITRSERKEVLSFSGWGLIVGICSRLVITITPFILGVVSNSDAVALFTLVSTIELYIYTFGTMISTFFMAKIARTIHDGTEEERAKKLQAFGEKIGKIQFVIIALIMGGFVSCGQEFTMMWLKDRSFLILYWCIIAISSYELVHIPQLIFREAMVAKGNIKPLAIASIIKALVNLGLSFGLSHLFTTNGTFSNLWFGSGAVGASLAIAFARIVEQIMFNFMFKKYLHADLGHFFKAIYIRGLIALAISAGIGLGIHFAFEIFRVFDVIGVSVKFLIIGFTFVFVFTLCTLFVIFNKEERAYYIDVFLRIIHIRGRKKKDAPAQAEQAPQAETSNGNEEEE